MLLRAARARRIAAATAFSGGGLTLLGASTVGILYLQAKLARRAVGSTSWDTPNVDGCYGDGEEPSLSFAMMGDSTAAGFAVTEGARTPGSLLASGIAAASERPVRMRNVAVVGATSQDLPRQMARLRAAPIDIAIIFIGANDVIQRVRPADSVRYLQEVVRELRESGTAVVVGTCPDLGTVRHFGWPLRYIVRRSSRQLAAAQTIAVVGEGGRTVSVNSLLAGEFWVNPEDMLGPDQFHPSARGYAEVASAVLPSACLALDLLPESQAPRVTESSTGILPIERAAVEAAEEPGTEVSGTRAAGRKRGKRDRWVARIQHQIWARQDTPPGVTAKDAETDEPTPESRGYTSTS